MSLVQLQLDEDKAIQKGQVLCQHEADQAISVSP